ncbi:DinB family protein [Thermogemmatispora sp.]|uniref:DinB family protein n=1 Tax=Thermogemmatispora sp. TaxID=1968838 RepID=UPI001DCFA83A|nr:DinB family protein [Thermogemmatispora sp.]MBX5451555.1 DinB family protein [Thermogemmatispora sp.]
MATLEDPFGKVRPKLVAARTEFLAELARFQAAELERRPSPEDWSALEVAYHLYVVDGLTLQELRRVQEEDNPALRALEKEGPRATRETAHDLSLDAVLAGMAARREEILQFLAELPAAAWERPCHHQTWGALKFYQLVNILAEHDRQHARQLVEIRQRLRRSDSGESHTAPASPLLSPS